MRAFVAFLILSVITACGGGSSDIVPVAVTVTPAAADVAAGDTVPFTAKVTGPALMPCIGVFLEFNAKRVLAEI